MRLPVSSETDAFRSVFVVATVVAVCLILGYLFGPVPAVVVASAAVAAPAAWMLFPSDSRLRRAEAPGRRRRRARRTLIAGEAPTKAEFSVVRAVLDREAPRA